jgi:hypothetical protein
MFIVSLDRRQGRILRLAPIRLLVVRAPPQQPILVVHRKQRFKYNVNRSTLTIMHSKRSPRSARIAEVDVGSSLSSAFLRAA